MTKFFLERHAFERVEAQRSKPPVYEDNHKKVTERAPAKRAVEAVDWPPEGEYPIEISCDVLMSELANQFRYSNERAVDKIRNFTALPGETTSQRQVCLARSHNRPQGNGSLVVS